MSVSTTSPLTAESFRADPKVVRAKRDLLDAMAHHQKSIAGVRPSDPLRAQSYAQTLDAFAQVRGDRLYFPYLGSGLGRGALVELADGSVKYDLINGIGVYHFGHSHPRLVEAALDAALNDTIMHGNLQQDATACTFSKKLLKAANARGARFDHCYLSSTGVMAGENALKITLQRRHPADRVLAFENCFAGRTLTFAQITDKPGFRDGLPCTLRVDYVPFLDAREPGESTERALARLREHLGRYPGRHAAMIFELVQGEGGFNPGSTRFHRALMQELRSHDVSVLVDEVQTFARTPELFAFQHYGLDDLVDVVWVGKASQVCATLFGKASAPRPGLLGQTYTASATAITAGIAVLDELLTGGYFGPGGKVVALHESFKSRLEGIAERHPGLLTGPYGIGAMIACTPFGGDARKVTDFIHALFNHGVIGFIAGANPTRARFLLPIAAITQDDIDQATRIIESTLTSM